MSLFEGADAVSEAGTGRVASGEGAVAYRAGVVAVVEASSPSP